MKRIDQNILFQSSHLGQDLAGKSVRGGVATITAQGSQFVLNLVGTMVLARILTPADFGLIGMVMVVVNFAQLFKDAGLSMATIQRDQISHEQISTLFWLNCAVSILLALCILIASPLVAWFYNRPELTAVTALLSLSFIFSGLAIQHTALLRRHMRFWSLACIRVASLVVRLVVVISLALVGWRYWALAMGSIVGALSGTLLTYYFCPWKPSGIRKGTGVRDMLWFGGHMTGFQFFKYFSLNADKILIGRYIGADSLGLYSKAYNLFMMPVTQIRTPLVQVTTPVLCSLQNQPERFAKYYQRLLDIVATLTMPLTLYCAIEADFLIRVTLGAKWLGAVPVFRILSIAGLIRAVDSIRGLVPMSCGFSRRFLLLGSFNAIVNVASFAVGLRYGITGVATSHAIARYALLLPSLYCCFYKTPFSVSLFMKTLVPPTLICGLAGLGIVATRYLFSGGSMAVNGLSAMVFGVIYAGLSWRRQPIRDTLGLLLKKRMLE